MCLSVRWQASSSPGRTRRLTTTMSTGLLLSQSAGRAAFSDMTEEAGSEKDGLTFMFLYMKRVATLIVGAIATVAPTTSWPGMRLAFAASSGCGVTTLDCAASPGRRDTARELTSTFGELALEFGPGDPSLEGTSNIPRARNSPAAIRGP